MSLFVAPDNLSMMISLHSEFVCPMSLSSTCKNNRIIYSNKRKGQMLSMAPLSSSQKVVSDPSLDRHVVKQNKIRFVHKLKTLLLSKPKHYMPLHILSKCRSYLSLSKPRSLMSMIHRYPTIFEVFTMPSPPNAAANKSGFQVCVRLTTAAEALATRESSAKSAMSVSLATKLQKLLMLSTPPHHRLLLSKLVHIAPDLGLPINFKSTVCNTHPHKFKIIDTSYGRALELVAWDPLLVSYPPPPPLSGRGLIIDRLLKFNHLLLRVRKGLNVKRRHQEWLIKFRDMPYVCPYTSSTSKVGGIEAEKRACGVVREVLGMMVEKRTLVDHLTHFRKDFGLPNKLRAMLVRHPDLFYVSVKGQRDSVFLLEAYNHQNGRLVEEENKEILMIKDKLMELVTQGKKLRRERRKKAIDGSSHHSHSYGGGDTDNTSDDDDDYSDFLDDLFENEEDEEKEDDEILGDGDGDGGEYWSGNAAITSEKKGDGQLEPW